MSINERLPRQLESALREIKDDDEFVDAMWQHAFILYHDLRAMELRNPTGEQHRQRLEKVEAAFHQLNSTLRVTGHDHELFKLAHQLKVAQKAYSDAATAAKTSSGRSTKNRTLIIFIGRVVEIFHAHDVPQTPIKNLIENHIALFAPDEEKDKLPSESSIKRAMASATKAGQ